MQGVDIALGLALLLLRRALACRRRRWMALACFLTYRLVWDMVHSFVAFVSVLTFEGNHAPSGAGRARTFMRPTSYV